MRYPASQFLNLSKDILSKGNTLRFKAQGFSMFPAIRNDDILNIVSFDPEKTNTGDVAFYKRPPDRLVAHRVVGINFKCDRPFILTKGDFLIGLPEKVFIEDILGRVMSIERNSKAIDLDNKLQKYIAGWHVCLSPYIRIIRVIGGRLLASVQSSIVYRNLARKIIRIDIGYQKDEAAGLVLAKIKDKAIARTSISEFKDDGRPYRGWWIFGTWVSPLYRRLGIGQKLTQKACERALQAGACQASLLVFEDNYRALSLYGKLGFYKTAIPSIDKELIEEAVKTGRRRIIMRKDL